MLSWLWSAVFGEEPVEADDTVGVSMTDLSDVSREMQALRSTIHTASEALASSEHNARLFYQSIEALLLESYDAFNEGVTVSPESAELQEMRSALEEQRTTVLAAMLKQKDAIEARLFRAQLQLSVLEKQQKNVEAAALQMDNPAVQAASVAFPAPVAPQFEWDASNENDE